MCIFLWDMWNDIRHTIQTQQIWTAHLKYYTQLLVLKTLSDRKWMRHDLIQSTLHWSFLYLWTKWSFLWPSTVVLSENMSTGPFCVYEQWSFLCRFHQTDSLFNNQLAPTIPPKADTLFTAGDQKCYRAWHVQRTVGPFSEVFLHRYIEKDTSGVGLSESPKSGKSTQL